MSEQCNRALQDRVAGSGTSHRLKARLYHDGSKLRRQRRPHQPHTAAGAQKQTHSKQLPDIVHAEEAQPGLLSVSDQRRHATSIPALPSLPQQTCQGTSVPEAVQDTGQGQQGTAFVTEPNAKIGVRADLHVTVTAAAKPDGPVQPDIAEANAVQGAPTAARFQPAAVTMQGRQLVTPSKVTEDTMQAGLRVDAPVAELQVNMIEPVGATSGAELHGAAGHIFGGSSEIPGPMQALMIALENMTSMSQRKLALLGGHNSATPAAAHVPAAAAVAAIPPAADAPGIGTVQLTD